jgi:hypothetical protein
MAMSVAAATHDEPVPGVVGEAAQLPIRDSAADLVEASISCARSLTTYLSCTTPRDSTS